MFNRALIPAGGRGIRAYPKTNFIPKVLLEIDGKPILQRNIEILRDSLGIRDITLIVSYMSDQIQHYFGDGSHLGVTLNYIDCPDPDIGLAQGMLLAKEFFEEPFVTILGDEVYLNSNHEQLRDFEDREYDAVCAMLPTTDVEKIKGNYSLMIENGRVVSLVEKPSNIKNNLLGCGSYIFTPKIFQAIEDTKPSSVSGKVELIDAIHSLAKGFPGVLPFQLTGGYFNINTVDEYNIAQYVVRAEQFSNYKVSVIIPAYNEEDSIGNVIRDFRHLVDEVFVINNSSSDNTIQVAKEAGARVETVSLEGYGDTIRYGLDHAKGDILVVVEADFSFRARDLNKLLEYLKDADMVIGTRTTRELIEQGTNMRGPVRWGNVFVAKFVELLWWGKQPRFTDVGCTYRALWRDTYQKIRPLLRGTGPELAPEMMIAVLQAHKRIIEVPVSYHKRVGGESKHSSNYFNISRTALRMMRTILYKRFERIDDRSVAMPLFVPPSKTF